MKRLFSFAGHQIPEQMKLYQLTEDPDVAGCHIYMEAQIFSPDSKRMVLHRSAHPHGSDAMDPKHQYYLCDFDDEGRLLPLTGERGVTAPALSPDGQIFYYFVDGLHTDGTVTLKSLDLRSWKRSVLDRVGPDEAPAYFFYPLSTISSDGGRLAIATGLRRQDGEGWPEHGLWIFDLERGGHRLMLHGEEFCNLHMQYCRSKEHPHLMMIQHNHGSRLAGKTDGAKTSVGKNHVAALDAAAGFALRQIRKSSDPAAENTGFGLDLHLFSDEDGSWGTLPVGRDGVEFGQGHQCWRGETTRAISSTLLFQTPDTALQELVELEPFPGAVHCWNSRSGGARNRLSRRIETPHFLHFATDRRGERIVSDYEADNGEWHLYAGRLGEMGEAAQLQCVCNLGSRKVSPWHPHPFLSPDGRAAFFNSSASGQLQAYRLELDW